jgi:membrane-bound ClpP family serine protease
MIGVVVALLLLGILLLLLEIVFVPGTTIVGIGGVMLMAIGIYLAYGLGGNVGHITLLSSLVLILLALGVMLKSKTWERLALKDSITSKSPANVVDNQLKEGDRGMTVGRLNPMGKAIFGDLTVEVQAAGELVDPDTEVEVVKVVGNRVHVRVARPKA